MKISMKVLGLVVAGASLFACTRQHDPRGYWAQYKNERIASNNQAPKLNPDGTIPQVKVAEKVAASPIDGKYESLCVTCHGANGAADSGAALAMNPKPRNLTDAAWQAKVTDEHIASVIKNGGAANGLSATMPAWGAVLSDDEVAQMVKKVRAFKK